MYFIYIHTYIDLYICILYIYIHTYIYIYTHTHRGDDACRAPRGPCDVAAVTEEGTNDTQATTEMPRSSKASHQLPGSFVVPPYPKSRELCPRGTRAPPERVFSPSDLSVRCTCGRTHERRRGTFLRLGPLRAVTWFGGMLMGVSGDACSPLDAACGVTRACA